MFTYNNLTIIGTSHISKESISKIKAFFKNNSPEIIALELDQARAKALTSARKPSLSLSHGIKVLFLTLLGTYIQRSLAKHTGSMPGSEMKTAIFLAKKHNIPIYLIDQPINITLKKITSRLTRKEKIQLFKDMLLSLIKKEKFAFDLNKIPSEKLISSLLKETRKKYPTLYEILVTERNKLMAQRLNKLMHSYKDRKILAIVGAGHAKQIIGELKSTKT